MNKYIILIYLPDRVLRREIEAETYWDALTAVSPGNDAVKVEIFGA